MEGRRTVLQAQRQERCGFVWETKRSCGWSEGGRGCEGVRSEVQAGARACKPDKAGEGGEFNPQ